MERALTRRLWAAADLLTEVVLLTAMFLVVIMGAHRRAGRASPIAISLALTWSIDQHSDHQYVGESGALEASGMAV